VTEPIRIVNRPSTRLFYQGYASGDDSEIAAQFQAKFGRPPAEIVRSPSAGSIILAGPVLNETIEELRKPHPRQREIDREAEQVLRRTA